MNEGRLTAGLREENMMLSQAILETVGEGEGVMGGKGEIQKATR